MRDLLFEIGTEEIPAGYLQPAYRQISEKFTRKAKELRIAHKEVKVMGTPRRLTLIVSDVAETQEDITEELLGPSKSAAYDDAGNYTKAAQGFAGSKGVDVSALQIVTTPKGEYLMLIREVKGRDSMELFPEILGEIINELSFPKSMKWGANKLAFVRPIQWILALYGDQIIEFEHEGIVSSNTTGGHRFHANTKFTVNGVASYLETLEKSHVIIDPVKRRAMVVKEINAALKDNNLLAGGSVAIDEDLVDTVTNLVESPVGVCGTFDEKFLQLVPEVLITSMREHQKYFPVVNSAGRLMPGFIAVNNTTVNNPDVTRKGHQRVLRARLEDALFFYNGDLKVPLEERVKGLDGIIFQAKLGTMLEKKDRLVKLVRIIAEKVNPACISDVSRAALLCKGDLLSDMVGEFPSLQGIMGAAYATNDKENNEVVLAIKEHYMPKRSGAELPSSDTGAVLALADRIDSLVGCFGIGLVPTGTADPFGLRRITLAILHIIEEKGYRFSLKEIVSKALALYGDKVDGSADTVQTILGFMEGRFKHDRTAKGESAGAVEAGVSICFDDVNDCLSRISAMAEIYKEPAFAVLASSYKRIRNIIKNNRDTTVSESLFEDEAEKNLFSLYSSLSPKISELVDAGEYYKALTLMLEMKEPVDRFFDKVMVMADDPAIKQNRLNLLSGLGDLILQVGDISKFQD
ncbi:glycine--tRNA ligase subunit beta [Desulforhopalus sp. IMCC35007]|uniref:glycine--tRNA ligase subunit beta n=1 Tax=Desulforhopalus sp. IMCC35007 TaxID=2569543 RepID=UPI0010AEBFB9|nr:glycine--tRNA ligase subunit beta [Desulforhopalus sp. IMCC35007]TKB09358.1 glycine--tRNA ligase subunit beta [Desulforhopalus sp. IMCC35007]